MKPHELALLYLQKAAEDEALLDEVLTSPRVSDGAIGFHCQQAAEKNPQSFVGLPGSKISENP